MKSEYYVNFNNTKLYFDFYVPEIFTFFECQGEQHFKFVKHFHGDRQGFIRSKFRDNDKIVYVQQEDKYLVFLNYNENITAKLVLARIDSAMKSPDHFAGKSK